MDALGQLCQEALVMPRLRDRHKLHEAVEFRDFYREELAGTVARWRARFTLKPGTQAASAPSPAPRTRRNAIR